MALSSVPSRRAPWSWPTTPPCWPARRACATTPRPTACWASRWPRSCPWCCSPRAAAGGLGVSRPEDIGPSDVQYANGVIDLLVDDEAQAVAAARHYLSFFQGRVKDWIAPDAHALRDLVPENRLRVYDTRAAMAGL